MRASAGAAIVAGVVVCFASQAGAQGRHVVTGKVVDAFGEPVPHALIADGRKIRIGSDDSGTFTIRTEPGRVVIDVKRLGFQPHRLVADVASDTTLVITLARVVATLDEQTITASRIASVARLGFYDRMRDRERGLNNGWFITPEDIEARRGVRTTQFLEQVPGMELKGRNASGLIPSGANGCPYTIFLDGGRIQTAGTNVKDGANSPSLSNYTRRTATKESREVLVTVDEVIGASSVAAIEVYPRAGGAPAQYQMLNGTCGIIAIWTKS